jgi:DNA replication and repair protein RecF
VTLQRLSVRDFRSYIEAEVCLGPGLTVVSGRNGAGKTNLLEAIGYLATLRSFRGVPGEALTRVGSDRAIIRGDLQNGSRSVLIETEIVPAGRARTLVNKQPVRRARELSDVLRVSVFSPEDLVLVKGGPGERRDWLDSALAALHQRFGALLDDLDRVLKQRNALLKQVATVGRGRLDESAALTLDVWDAKLAETGTAVVNARLNLLAGLQPALVRAYADIAGSPLLVTVGYGSGWLPGGTASGGLTVEPESQEGPVPSTVLADALTRSRLDDVRRGVSLVGPHRDDVVLSLSADGLVRPSRTHASQGEQRTLALSMRLAVHRHLTSALDTAPLLLLDDVFSELDPHRSAALVRHLPMGQAVLATAIGAPDGVEVESTIDVDRLGASSRVVTREAVGKPGESVDGFALENMT